MIRVASGTRGSYTRVACLIRDGSEATPAPVASRLRVARLSRFLEYEASAGARAASA